jgi:hypothetical protein
MPDGAWAVPALASPSATTSATARPRADELIGVLARDPEYQARKAEVDAKHAARTEAVRAAARPILAD